MEFSSDFTVLQLNRSIKTILHSGFPEFVWIRGIVKGIRKVSGRGHSYFQLTDPADLGGQTPAVVDCALFAGDNSRISIETGRTGQIFQLENDTEVRILVSVNFYDRSGRFQLLMKGFDADFAGETAAVNLQKLVAKLSKEGVLAENGTMAFPVLPLTVGLVTSKGSAAEKDFVKTLDESGYPFRVYAAYASMQGSSTSESVCSAFNRLVNNPVSSSLDAVVLTRGGGSATDLAWFNDERIARTIAQLPWIVISGIGHEIDTTLPDYAAHTRAKTPTHAASFLVDIAAGFDDRISILNSELVSAVLPKIQMEKLKVKTIADSLAVNLSSLPSRKIRVLQILASKLGRTVTDKLHSLFMLIAESEKQIEMHDPTKMMKLGWTIVRDENGLPIKNIASVNSNQTIKVSIQGGSLTAVVKEVDIDRKT